MRRIFNRKICPLFSMGNIYQQLCEKTSKEDLEAAKHCQNAKKQEWPPANRKTEKMQHSKVS